MTCIQCGNEIPDTATFCPYCGSSQTFNGTASEQKGTEQSDSTIAGHEQQDTQNDYSNADQAEYTYGKEISSYLPLAIFSSLCCCIPLGIVAVLYATKVPEYIKYGRYKEAEEYSRKAMYWAIGAIAAGLLVQGITTTIQVLMQYFNGGF